LNFKRYVYNIGTFAKKFKKSTNFFFMAIKKASQDLYTTGLEGCLPASGDDAFHDWFLFLGNLF